MNLGFFSCQVEMVFTLKGCCARNEKVQITDAYNKLKHAMCITIGESNQTQKATYYMVPFIWYLRKSNTLGNEIGSVDARSSG